MNPRMFAALLQLVAPAPRPHRAPAGRLPFSPVDIPSLKEIATRADAELHDKSTNRSNGFERYEQSTYASLDLNLGGVQQLMYRLSLRKYIVHDMWKICDSHGIPFCTDLIPKFVSLVPICGDSGCYYSSSPYSDILRNNLQRLYESFHCGDGGGVVFIDNVGTHMQSFFVGICIPLRIRDGSRVYRWYKPRDSRIRLPCTRS